VVEDEEEKKEGGGKSGGCGRGGGRVEEDGRGREKSRWNKARSQGKGIFQKRTQTGHRKKKGHSALREEYTKAKGCWHHGRGRKRKT